MVLKPEVAKVFPNDKAVNEALQELIKIAEATARPAPRSVSDKRQSGLRVAQTEEGFVDHIPADKRMELIDLLQSWIEERDAQEQKETGEYLIQALDEDRLSDRRLFPSELKGVTW